MMSDESAAPASLSKLIEHVFNHRDGLIQPICYNELAKRIGRLNKYGNGHGHGMGGVLGKMGHLLEDIGDQWGEPIPHIQSLVVNLTGKLKGLPDLGIKEFWPDYPQMTLVEKANRAKIEHQRIVAFGSRWNDVLKQLRLPLVTSNGENTSSTGQYGCGGESLRHKRLKEFIQKNPKIVGAEKDWLSFIEYPLPSLDEIDVLFKSTNMCIAVEVKSAVSDNFPSDYERGLFQTVKYSALLTAMSCSGAYGIPSKIKTILLLESCLPVEFRSLANALSVTILENIKITDRA